MAAVFDEGSGRSLAYVAEVSELLPVEGADRIEVAQLRGWRCVVAKGVFHKGQRVVYCEIDSVLPPWDCFKADLEKCAYRVRTVKIRKQLSQGYVFPLSRIAECHPQRASFAAEPLEEPADGSSPAVLRFADGREPLVLRVGADLTDFLGVRHYDDVVREQHAAAVAAHAAAVAAGNTALLRGPPPIFMPFPSFFPKTDQPRIQNLPELPELHGNVPFEVTEKLDGSSHTVFSPAPGQVGVCSRNHALDLAVAATEPLASVLQLLRESGVLMAVEQSPRRVALQGEFLGPKVCGNPYKLTAHQWRVFDVFLIEEGRFAMPRERVEVLREIGLDPATFHVPVVARNVTVGGKTADQIVADADGTTSLPQAASKAIIREGLVYKSEVLVDGQILHFKAVSNAFLLKRHTK